MDNKNFKYFEETKQTMEALDYLANFVKQYNASNVKNKRHTHWTSEEKEYLKKSLNGDSANIKDLKKVALELKRTLAAVKKKYYELVKKDKNKQINNTTKNDQKQNNKIVYFPASSSCDETFVNVLQNKGKTYISISSESESSAISGLMSSNISPINFSIASQPLKNKTDVLKTLKKDKNNISISSSSSQKEMSM